MIGWLFDVETLAAVLTLTALELVLGIDNVVFIAILAGKLPPAERDRVRIIGLVLAGAGRIALLFSIVWIMGLTADVFYVFGRSVSWRDLILLLALSFLLMIGTVLVGEGLRIEVPKGSVYFAMGFAVFVELLNIRLRKVTQRPVALREPYVERDAEAPR